jgi:hypothetical protein
MNNNDSTKTVQNQYKPVKLFAFEAWKIWNDLTDAAESLWEEYEYDFVEFCLQETKSHKNKTYKYPF